VPTRPKPIPKPVRALCEGLAKASNKMISIHPDHHRRANRLKIHTRPRMSRFPRRASLTQTPIINITIRRKKTVTRPLIIHMESKYQTRKLAINHRAATGQAMGPDIIENGTGRYLAELFELYEFDASSPCNMLLVVAQRHTVSRMNTYYLGIRHAPLELSPSQFLTVLHLCIPPWRTNV
jgi:hypothetical protein